MAHPANILPPSLAPRGLSRVQSAAYIGVGATLFDELVDDGRMPSPKRINSKKIWDRLGLDEAFDSVTAALGAGKSADELEEEDAT